MGCRLQLLAGLLGKKDKVRDRTELVVLLTEKVVKKKNAVRLVSCEFRHKLIDTSTDYKNKESMNSRTVG